MAARKVPFSPKLTVNLRDPRRNCLKQSGMAVAAGIAGVSQVSLVKAQSAARP